MYLKFVPKKWLMGEDVRVTTLLRTCSRISCLIISWIWKNGINKACLGDFQLVSTSIHVRQNKNNLDMCETQLFWQIRIQYESSGKRISSFLILHPNDLLGKESAYCINVEVWLSQTPRLGIKAYSHFRCPVQSTATFLTESVTFIPKCKT